jgi:tetratricopeptide (TPR) repeat protein
MAYTALASLREDEDELEEAEEYFLKAIELNPNYATAYHWYGLLLDRLNRGEETSPYFQKAVELDPLAPVLAVGLAYSRWDYS